MTKWLVLFALVASTSVFAQKRIVSVDAFDLAYSGGLSFTHKNGKNTDENGTNFRLNLNYAQNIENYVGLMWKANVHFNRQDIDFGASDSFESAYGVAGGLLYNFQPDDIKNSIMAGIQGGVERAAYELGAGKEKTGFNLFMNMEVGKRWDLGQYSMANISYAPTVFVQFKRYGGGIRDDYFKSGNEIRFNFLKFDILF